MANFTLQDFFDAVEVRVNDASEGTADRTSTLNFLNEGLRRIRRKFDIPTAERISQLTVFKDVYEYVIPTGYKDFISLNEQRKLQDDLNFKRTDEKDFWRDYDHCNAISESRNGATNTLLVSWQDSEAVNALVHNCDTYDGDGTFTANTTTSDALNVATETLYYREGSGSVRFDIDVSQSVNNYAEIYVNGFTQVDLSGTAIKDVGTMFAYVYLPSVAVQYTSFTLRWGSDSSNYWESTVTAPFGGGSFVAGWNLLGFSWLSATKTGSPSASAVDYLLFRATYPASMTDQTGLRLDYVIMRQPKILDLHYSSDYLVVDGTTGAFKETFDSTSDTTSYFLCPAEFVDWLTYHTLENVFQYVVKDAPALAQNTRNLMECESDLIARHPSRRDLPSYSYLETDSLADAQN